MAVSSSSIISLNVSLFVNSVSFYQASVFNLLLAFPFLDQICGLLEQLQVCKLLIIPTTAILEWFATGDLISPLQAWAILVILVGVSIVYVSVFPNMVNFCLSASYNNFVVCIAGLFKILSFNCPFLDLLWQEYQ